MSANPSSVAAGAVDRWLLLHGAEAAAEAVPPTRREAARSLQAAARARVDGALGEHGVAALVLVRTAIPLLVEAAVTARSSEAPEPGTPLARLWERYDEIVADGLLPVVPPWLVAARADTLSQVTPDAEIAEHGDVRVDDALSLAGFLEEVVELRTPRAIRTQRRLRQAALGVAVVAALAALVVHGARPPSVALHANVLASSRRPDSGPPSSLTNGKLEPTVAFATKDEPDPWLTVDLATAVRVSEVTLYTSSDHRDDSLPLRIETSADGTTWEGAGLQTAAFGATEPAVVSFGSRSARFVRIHGKPKGAIYLTEVEVR